ncbi:hypothetical protein KSI01_19490 [Kurthia sibirica]|uniref:Ig-like domain-containing protein n=1 Tax=Kurthia sibirica TaxID=202750 RepID=UPI0011678F81|nr:Ig-like domain-containing protein [Kurthia sibirica]GEK34416.1 hypothetical protein KSI01_19490 [Kurthia sibirica]
MKRILSVILTWVLLLSLIVPSVTLKASAKAFDPNEEYKDLNLRFWNDEKPNERFYINAASRYILETVKEPKMGSTFGEWSVMDLLRGMYTGVDYINYIPADYFTKYTEGINTYVESKAGELDRNKSTEWSRLTLAMTALGIPITNVGGYDFVDRLSQSYKFSYRQGINGPIWELIALDTGNYEMVKIPSKYTEGDINTKGRMIDYILGKEIVDKDGIIGGWALAGKVADPDITGMALQALAPYYLNQAKYQRAEATATYEEFKKAVERAVLAMAKMQQPGGGFNAWGNVNAESTSQVIVALTALKIDPKTKSVELPTIGKTATFNREAGINDGVTTDNMIDMLVSFFAEGSGSSPEVSGFKHVTAGYDGGGGSGTGVNAMATDQALYGLIAYDRFKNGEKSLYDMTDQSAGQYKNMKTKRFNITFHTAATKQEKQASPYSTVKIPASSPTTNEKITSWNSKADGSGTVYLANELLVVPEHDIELYAQFKANTYTILFNLNGGQFNKVMMDRYTSTEEVILPQEKELKKEGYIFVGWYENAAYTGSTITKIAKGSSGNKQYYAKWVDQWALANEVNALIMTLPTTITEKNEIQVKNIRAAYDKLTVEDRIHVTNYGKLLDAELQLQQLLQGTDEELTDEEKAMKLVEMINMLPSEENLTLQDQASIQAVRTAYTALTVSQKMNVSNYSILLKLEKVFEKIEGVEIDEQVASEVTNKIKLIPKVSDLTLVDEEVINLARTAYDVIKMSQQKLVKNYNTLLQAELALEVLKNDKLIEVNPVKNKTTVVTGKTTANTEVTVLRSGIEIASSKTTSKGLFSIKIPAQTAGTKLVVKTNGASKTVVVEVSKILATPTVNAIGEKSTEITGKATKGMTIFANVKGTKIGTATVSSSGNYTMKIKAQKKGTKVSITIKDAMNNKSGIRSMTVQAAKKLATPSANSINSKSTKITGKATKGMTVFATVKGTKIGTATVSSSGNYTMKIKAQKKGAKILIAIKDGMNNKSKIRSITVK